MSTPIQWLTASPLWTELSALPDLTPFRRPAILRFTSDDFVPELQEVLQQTPQKLRSYVAQGENWQAPAAGLNVSAGGSLPLKLYQPAQARFYMVATSLTCRQPGLPDHSIDRTQGENAVFVVRQLRPNPGFSVADCAVYDPAKCTTKCMEYAWIPGDQPGWTKVSDAGLVAGEEQIPLSPMQASQTKVKTAAPRRVLTGLIPASRRQQYVAGRTFSNGNGSGSGNGNKTVNGLCGVQAADPRADMFNRQVVQPWGNLNLWWGGLIAADQADSQYQTSANLSSALILLDFANILISDVPNVWAAIGDGSKVAGLSSPEAALYTSLDAGLQVALINAKQFEGQLETAGLTDPPLPASYTPYSLALDGTDPCTLVRPFNAALPPQPPPDPGSIAPPIPQKPANPQGDFYFIVRCAYLRPQCGSTVVSPPSQPFLLASFFDSDAPARRIQVALPVDTSPAALRKYDKGVAFLISDELKKQMARVASLKDLSNGNIGAPSAGLDIGMICSFSIPIITICALILLLVIVIALNLVFFWVPFFKICLPVPTLKGK
jgi:hypothetical protein